MWKQHQVEGSDGMSSVRYLVQGEVKKVIQQSTSCPFIGPTTSCCPYLHHHQLTSDPVAVGHLVDRWFSSQVTRAMGELDHRSLSVVGKKVFATKYANYFDVRLPAILAWFCPNFHPCELVLDLVSKNDPLHLLFI